MKRFTTIFARSSSSDTTSVARGRWLVAFMASRSVCRVLSSRLLSLNRKYLPSSTTSTTSGLTPNIPKCSRSTRKAHWTDSRLKHRDPTWQYKTSMISWLTLTKTLIKMCSGILERRALTQSKKWRLTWCGTSISSSLPSLTTTFFLQKMRLMIYLRNSKAKNRDTKPKKYSASTSKPNLKSSRLRSCRR